MTKKQRNEEEIRCDSFDYSESPLCIWINPSITCLTLRHLHKCVHINHWDYKNISSYVMVTIPYIYIHMYTYICTYIYIYIHIHIYIYLKNIKQ